MTDEATNGIMGALKSPAAIAIVVGLTAGGGSGQASRLLGPAPQVAGEATPDPQIAKNEADIARLRDSLNEIDRRTLWLEFKNGGDASINPE